MGIALPAAMAFLGLAFVCCALLVTGMPPLAGFIAKFAMVAVAIESLPPDGSFGREWLLIVSAAGRWSRGNHRADAHRDAPVLECQRPSGRRGCRCTEAGPVAFLILVCVAMTIAAGPVMTYLDSAAAGLADPALYIDSVLHQSHAGWRHEITPADPADPRAHRHVAVAQRHARGRARSCSVSACRC